MATTPRPLIDSVVRSVCGREGERVVRLTGGGMNETYRVELPNEVAVVVRIARQPVPWFTDEEHVMAQARGVGVPTPEVLGVEQVDHDGELLSFAIQRLVPGRSLDELAGELPASDLERLVMDGGELLARVHSVVPDRGIRHELQPPDKLFVGRVARVVDQALGPAAAAVRERGADLLRRGYARVTDPDSADAGWVPAFAIDWALEKLGWQNPAPPAQQRRCVDVIARYAGARPNRGPLAKGTAWCGQ